MSSPVLVVDDDVDLATTLASALGELGYEASFVTSGGDALARLEAGVRPRVILLDLMMPEMSGWEVCDRLHQSPDLDGIPVIVMTAAANLRRPPPPHARAVLRKPFDLDELVEHLEAA